VGGVPAVLRPGSSAFDPLGRRAGYADGLASTAVGIAANESIASGRAVDLDSLGIRLDLDDKGALGPRR